MLVAHQGEIKVAKNGELLRALLGSCVGIGLIWQERAICGLAHCLLPTSPTKSFEIGGKYVDQAFRSLVAMMKIRPSEVEQIQTVIVGGGNMTDSSASAAELIGTQNFNEALRQAKNLKLPVEYSEGGGNQGRTLSIDSLNYGYRVELIPRTLNNVEV